MYYLINVKRVIKEHNKINQMHICYFFLFNLVYLDSKNKSLIMILKINNKQFKLS